jgi:membrane-associated phospholipid phosphatase
MDWSLFHWFNRLQVHTTWANGVLRVYATDGIALFAVVIVAAWWVARRDHDQRRVAGAAWAGCAALVALGLNQVIGHLVRRQRPYLTHPGVHVLVARTTDFSFPSDHLVVGASVAAAVFLVDRRLGIAAIVLACIMAFARVYVGAHYPGDVLGGAVIGVGVALAGWPLASRILEPLAAGLARSRLRPLALVGGGPLPPP